MKALMIGAHQDDNEFRCGGLAAILKKKGWEVCFLSLTSGGGGHHILSTEETIRQRAKESAAVAELLGIQYEVWDNDDGALLVTLENRRRLIRFIRTFAPDLIITHRPNDYHPDHRAAGQLVQDASYMLIVPHECPDVPALRRMPVIAYNEDAFRNPPFTPDLVVDVSSEIETKLKIADLNVSQVYEWLPYTKEETVPESREERLEWLKGMDITEDTTDEEILAAKRGYSVRFAKPAARFRDRLIELYGPERGVKIRYAEAYGVCEYGRPLTAELRNEILG